jgi:hypothetical protein
MTAWFLPRMKGLLASGSFKAEFCGMLVFTEDRQVGSFYVAEHWQGVSF